LVPRLLERACRPEIRLRKVTDAEVGLQAFTAVTGLILEYFYNVFFSTA
jgi:hypothetical protein